ncbi:MAG: NUDIX domain-containing protein [Patescibacteria group bacterium]
MLKNPDKKERTVKKQTVAGFVIFRRTEEGVKYLLLYKRGEYWNFPKGHFEEGEESLDTAFREAEEETGLKKNELHILPGFKAYEKFHFYSATEKIYDTVILYLAETKQPRVLISLREHSGYAWFLYSDAMKILRRYAETRKVLKQAHDFLRGPSNPRNPKNPPRPNHNIPRSGSPRRPMQGPPNRRPHPHPQFSRRPGNQNPPPQRPQ